MHQFEFVAPRSCDDAISQLRERGPGGKILAGGTDLLLQVKARTLRPTYLVDLSHLDDLFRLETQDNRGLWIGSMVRMRTIQRSPLTKGRYAILTDGASLVGSIQIRNLATIGGNMCNAAPSADAAPPLIAAHATAEILGPDGRRSVPLEQFFLGPRRTVLNSDELLLGVFVPRPGDGFGGNYVRHTPRREMDIAVVGVGSTVTIPHGVVAETRIALGAVEPTPIRATRARKASLATRPQLSPSVPRPFSRR